MYQLNRLLQPLVDLLFPPQCSVCQSGGAILCENCIAAISWLQAPLCSSCGIPQAMRGLCMICQYRPLHLSGLRAISTYQDPLRSSIHALKYKGNTRLGEPLGILLAQAYRFHQLQVDMIIPVPLHRERLRQRGYNQAQLLAQSCAHQLQLPISTTALMRIRTTSTQVKLSAQARLANLQHAFCCPTQTAHPAIVGRKLLLIDDVCTTGATLEACAAPLFAAGAREVWGLVLARPIVTKRGTPT